MKKNICFLLLGACLVILALEVKSTYAKYLTTAEGKGNRHPAPARAVPYRL